jgi:hypothetical protein
MNQMFHLLVIGILLTNCNVTTNNEVKESSGSVRQGNCNQNHDTALLKYANEFNPTEINLQKNISKELDSFLLNAYTVCLRKQTKYEFFIAAILANLYYYHLSCCNQGYNLLSMKAGSAGIIINEFENLAGYKSQNLEMLNSEIIVDYLELHPQLRETPLLKLLLEKIKKEATRIDKGTI